jgi:hypothetical protein
MNLNHVNPKQACSEAPEGDFDVLPDGGAIKAGDGFDPTTAKTIGPSHDFMTYACGRWVSPVTWKRVFDKV